MKTIAISLFLLVMAPLPAEALNTYNDDLLSYVAMPLAVSAVCDVRGVQTDRVGRLVTYMDQANVSPADFVDVFRYVPVALVMRTDRRPDFVEWTHQQVVNGIGGPELVTVMEQQLRGYDDYVPVSTVRTHRRRTSNDYGYRYAFEDSYVPVTIRRHCERLILDPLSLVEMPVAVASVYDLRGIPYDRVSNLVVELNLGDVPPVQFVEVMRYAPAALIINDSYYGQPDFVQFVRTERIGGVSGYGLVGAIDQRFRAYDFVPQIDLAPPAYYGRTDYSSPVVNYVAPVDAMYVPPIVQTRIAAVSAGSAVAWNRQAPAVAYAPQQVQRLLRPSKNEGAVVVNPAQARRELAQADRSLGAANRGRGQAAVMAARQSQTPPVFTAPSVHGNGRGNGKQRHEAAPMVMASPGRGRGHERPATAAPPQVIARPAPPAAHGHGNGNGGNGNGKGHGRHEASAPVMIPQSVPVPAAAPPVVQQHGNGNGGNGNGKGHGRHEASAPVMNPPSVPVPAAAPPVVQEHGNGHGHEGAQPPGQEKNKGKGKHQ